MLVIILIVLGVLLLACAGICGGCLLVAQRAATEVGSAIELLPIQAAASEAVLGDPAVMEKLGAPVQQTSPAAREGSGEVQPAGETFTFDLSGPKGKAKVRCSALKDAGTWRLTVITVECSDGTTLNVTPPAPSGPNVQFDMPETPDAAGQPSDDK